MGPVSVAEGRRPYVYTVLLFPEVRQHRLPTIPKGPRVQKVSTQSHTIPHIDILATLCVGTLDL